MGKVGLSMAFVNPLLFCLPPMEAIGIMQKHARLQAVFDKWMGTSRAVTKFNSFVFEVNKLSANAEVEMADGISKNKL